MKGERKIEVTGRQKQLLDELKEMRSHWKLKEKVLDCTLFGRGYGPVVR